MVPIRSSPPPVVSPDPALSASPVQSPRARRTPARRSGPRVVAIACLLSILLGLPATTAGARPGAAERCFSETGKCVSGRFLDYWNAHGRLAINGYLLLTILLTPLPCRVVTSELLGRCDDDH